MSGITLSASVRQNLLSLQSTADLLSTTQNRLSTGKKVNTALDNPTNFFTAASLDARSGDINNLLDGISNGVQVLQAANTGITSLTKLVDTAKSIANQVLQVPVGYSTKSNVQVNIPGATASNLLGAGAPIDAIQLGTAKLTNQIPVYSSASADGSAVNATHQTAYVSQAAVLGSTITGAVTGSVLSTAAGGALVNGDQFTVNGKTISFVTSGAATADGNGNYTIGIDQTLGSLLSTIDTVQGNTGAGSVASTVSTNKLQLNTGVAADLALVDGAGAATGTLAKLGLSTAQNTARTGGATSTVPITSATRLSSPAVAGGADALASGLTTSDYLIVNNKTISFHAGSGSTGSIATNDLSIGLGNGTINDILTAVGAATGGTVTVGTGGNAGKLHLVTTSGADINLTGSSAGTLGKLGIGALPSNTVSRASTGGPVAISGATVLSGAATTTSNALSASFIAGDSISVNGQNINFVASGASGNNQINVTDNITQLLAKIDALSGAAPGSSTVSGGGVISLHTGVTSDLAVSSTNPAAFAALGFAAAVTKPRDAGTPALTGQTLAIAATNPNSTATLFTFGTGAGQVSSLNDLNAKLAANNLQATLAGDGTLTIATSNTVAASTIGAITGTATGVGQVFAGLVGNAPVVDAASQAQRQNLVAQYNNVITQIVTTSQDSSFNGVNLLDGDNLKLTFNETGRSTLNIQGSTLTPAGLGLRSLGTADFLDNTSANDALASLNGASTILRSQASALGSNLSIVQIRQDFAKNLINVLQTGSSQLTLADTNEEAANSQALSTRQSIAVSALALANQSQQSVLKLLQ